MTLLRACLMQVRARHGDWDSAPVVAFSPEELSARRTGNPFSSGHPRNLPDPSPQKALHALWADNTWLRVTLAR